MGRQHVLADLSMLEITDPDLSKLLTENRQLGNEENKVFLSMKKQLEMVREKITQWDAVSISKYCSEC